MKRENGTLAGAIVSAPGTSSKLSLSSINPDQDLALLPSTCPAQPPCTTPAAAHFHAVTRARPQARRDSASGPMGADHMLVSTAS